MSRWETVQQAALGTHGIITFARAKAMGVCSAELYRWTESGRLVKIGRGAFRLAAYPLRGLVSDMAAILASIGDAAYLYGESALQFYRLCPTRSYCATVAYPHRIRRQTLPPGVTIVKGDPAYEPVYPEGIACQRPEDAIRSCIGVLEKSVLEEAVETAADKGYFLPGEVEQLKQEIAHGETTPQ